MKKKRFTYGLVLLGFFILTACAPRERIVYLQNIHDSTTVQNYDPKLQPDDLLSIIVNSENVELTKPYNLFAYAQDTRQDIVTGQQRLQNYLIDSQGNIEFPVLGTLKLSGKTRIEAQEFLKEQLKSSIKDVSVNIRILNFKVTIQGEVAKPGTYNIDSERITLLEALSKAGDLTIYGKRDNVLIIREVDGKKTYNHVDITKSDFIDSPFYYLSQNDLVYVEPNKTKINSSAVGPNISVVLSAVSVLASVISVIAVISR